MDQIAANLKDALFQYFSHMEAEFKKNRYYIAVAETAEGYSNSLDHLISVTMEEARVAAGRENPKPIVCPHCNSKTPTNEFTWEE